MAIRFFDMFAGIGGFRSGLEAVGGFECVGHCEIDITPAQKARKKRGRVI
ncbi:DNA cytosine methyltransferase [Acutalibacter intestini]